MRLPGPVLHSWLRTALVALALACVASPARLSAQAILNVERLQPTQAHGWHVGVAGSLDLSRGNDEHSKLSGGVATGYRWSRDWLRLFAGIDYRADGDGTLHNDRYAHLRYNHWWRTRLQSFHFLQIQRSRDGFQQDRVLVGTGLRTRLVNGARSTFDVGTGIMYEHERLDARRIVDEHPVTEDVVRMANLLVLNRRLSDDVRFLGVAYLQPRLDALGDVRTLTDLSLFIALTEAVELAVRFQWRHDSCPPAGRAPDDVGFTTGFAVKLR